MRRPLALGLALVLAACAGSTVAEDTTTSSSWSTTTTSSTTEPSTTTTTLAVSDPRYGGEAIVGDDQAPPTLNPYAPGGDNFIVSKIAQALHVGVFDIDATTRELIPELVTEVPTVANGGLTVNDDGTMRVRYTIRDEAVWADGVPISGYDFAFTYETLAAIESMESFTEHPLGIVPESVVAGDKTFEYALEFETLEWESLFRYIIPQHQVEGTDFLQDWNTTPWLSGGPFVFDSWTPGQSVRVIRNPNYWKSDSETGLQLPYLDAVEFRFIPETTVLLGAFRNRDIDVINPPPFLPDLEGLAALDGADVSVVPGPIWEHFNFQFGPNNRNEDSLNRYVDFRRAVAHALDRDAIVAEILRGFGYPMDSYIDAFTPEWSTGAWARYPHDPDAARALLADLCTELERDCAANPPRVVFSTTSNGDVRIVVANLLERQLEAVGIDVELDLEDSSLFFGSTLDRGTWDMGLWAWVGSPGLAGLVSIHDIFDPNGPPPDGMNFYRWGTPAVTGSDEPEFDQGVSFVRDEHTERFAEVVAAMNRTVDRDGILALIAEAEEILADQVVIIPVYGRLDPGVVWADEIGGYVHNPSQASDLWNVEYWYRVDD